MTETQLQRAASICAEIVALESLRYQLKDCRSVPDMNYTSNIRHGNVACRIRDVFIESELARLKAEAEAL